MTQRERGIEHRVGKNNERGITSIRSAGEKDMTDDAETVREALDGFRARLLADGNIIPMGWVEDAIEALGRLTARLDAAERELQAARQMRDAFGAFDDAEGRGLTRQAIQAFRNKEQAIKGYDAIRALSPQADTEVQ